MEEIKFKISIAKENSGTFISALEYHSIDFTMMTQKNQKFYLFSFTADPLCIFDVGGTFNEYLALQKKQRPVNR